MPLSVPQEKSVGGGAVSTLGVTLPNPIGTGSILVAGANGNNGPTITFTDDVSDPVTDSGHNTISGNVDESAMAAFLTATAGSRTVTAHFSVTPGFTEVVAWEVAGFTAPAYDKSIEVGATSGTTATSGSSGPLASANEVGISYCISQNGAVANSQGAGWTPDDNTGGLGLTANTNFVQHIVTSSASAITATCTVGSPVLYDMWLLTFQSTSSPPAGVNLTQIWVEVILD